MNGGFMGTPRVYNAHAHCVVLSFLTLNQNGKVCFYMCFEILHLFRCFGSFLPPFYTTSHRYLHKRS